MPPLALRAAIVYLSQVRHSSYGRDSLAMLQESLLLLFQNYRAAQRHDVLVFHTGDFGLAEQSRVLAPLSGRPVRFERVPAQHWRLPVHVAPWLADDNRTTWTQWPKYSLGYRHMIRWYVVGLWETLEAMGYTWCMRMDEDSRILSPIDYNLFTHMASRGGTYVCAASALTSGSRASGFSPSALTSPAGPVR